jgi:hypothetical protein
MASVPSGSELLGKACTEKEYLREQMEAEVEHRRWQLLIELF